MSPRLREPMVGLQPSEASSSLCQPMLSRPSRYRLQSSELKLQPLRSATVSQRRRSSAGHCGGRIKHRFHSLRGELSLAEAFLSHLSVGGHSGASIRVGQLSVPAG